MKKEMRYLVPNDYMADPAVHVFEGKVYIYPSHDWESGIPENDNGDHFNMKDYHVFSTDDIMNGEITDHGVVLSVEDIPWAGRQLWDCDVAYANGKYYMYFPLKTNLTVYLFLSPIQYVAAIVLTLLFSKIMMSSISILAVFGAVNFNVIETTRLWNVQNSRTMICQLFHQGL